MKNKKTSPKPATSSNASGGWNLAKSTKLTTEPITNTIKPGRRFSEPKTRKELIIEAICSGLEFEQIEAKLRMQGVWFRREYERALNTHIEDSRHNKEAAKKYVEEGRLGTYIQGLQRHMVVFGRNPNIEAEIERVKAFSTH